MALISFSKNGLYCPRADVYVDPWRKVNRAIITHGHSDHARRGMEHYLCSKESVAILKSRLGKNINVQGQSYNEPIFINGVRISLHPAGHILGSAQVRFEYKDEVWVITGDYKTENDLVSGKFQPVKCHHFVTETTFALPIFQWKDQFEVYNEINRWWALNASLNRTSVIQAYSLGKAQRLIRHLDKNSGKIFAGRGIRQMNDAYMAAGVDLGVVHPLEEASLEDLKKGIIIGSTRECPFEIEMAVASASGWNQVQRTSGRGGTSKNFVLSDHCDWKGLNQTIEAVEAESIYVTHGYEEAAKKWLIEQGKMAEIVSTEFSDDR